MAHEEASLTALDYQIDLHTRLARTHQDMAEYFTETAAEHRAMAEYWTGLRNEYLGAQALDNVVILHEATGGQIA